MFRKIKAAWKSAELLDWTVKNGSTKTAKPSESRWVPSLRGAAGIEF
jgi:hypothetical protein